MKPRVKKCPWGGWTVENAPVRNHAPGWSAAFLYALNVFTGYRLDEFWAGQPIRIGNDIYSIRRAVKEVSL